jgi:hypothetical protein
MPQKHFDMSGKSVARIYHRAICKTPWPCPTAGGSARLQAKNPFTIEVAPARRSE